ncbi:hypothetical protein [Ralstonia phage RSF1]|uniref:Uncharacterized protein n=1 Tax=Ralstonia phage RSF1 TaxID=1689679 RepID=A0A0K2QQF3_9CAUD|nr:hypothetical protein AVU11_agp05 [Ralstonia phage RSF1]BAS04802.2 hypothetical protein [Ralstonia phage RSF1]
MKEPEFTKTADGQYWMDTSVISDIPFKITIIDPREHISAIMNIFQMLPSIQEYNFTKPALTHLVRTIVITIMEGIVNRRRAWVYGEDTDWHIHLMNLRELIGFDIEAELREELRYDLNDPANKQASGMLDDVLKQLLALTTEYMNPNRFVLHRLTQSRDLRTLMIEEYSDWRVIQWTKAEQEKIANRHETI